MTPALEKADLYGGAHPAIRTGARPHLQKMTELADRGFFIYSEQAPAKDRKTEAKMPGARRTQEAYSHGGTGGSSAEK